MVTGAEEDGAGARQQECFDNAFTKKNDIHRCHRCCKEHMQDFHPNKARQPRRSSPAASRTRRPTAAYRGAGRLQPRPDPAGASPAKAQKSRGRGPTTCPSASHHRRGNPRIWSRGHGIRPWRARIRPAGLTRRSPDPTIELYMLLREILYFEDNLFLTRQHFHTRGQEDCCAHHQQLKP